MRILLLPLTARFVVYTFVLLVTAILLAELLAGNTSLFVVIPLVPFAALAALGTMDLIQSRHAVLRNYPLTAHIRFILEEIRPEIRQYFLESEKDGTPFSRDKRALVYQRAKRALDKRPFGTQNDVYASGYEWLHHSIAPKLPVPQPFRVVIGGPDCGKPYSASVFNISAMSFGALSPNAIRSLNIGARKGNFAHDTGEGGLQPLSPRKRRRPHLGNRLGLFQLPQRRRLVLRREIRRRRAVRPGQDDRAQAQPGRKPGHGGVLPAPRSRRKSPRPAACRPASTAFLRHVTPRFRRRSR